MKALIVIATVAVTLLASGIPMANAAFFDVSQGWWMAESQWTKSTTGGNNIMQNGDILEVIGTGVTGYAEYRSNWTLGMNENFAFSTSFFYNPPSEKSIMKLGLIPTGATGINGVSIGRGDERLLPGDPDRPYIYWEVDLGSGDTEYQELDLVGGGTFSASYTSSNKNIILSAFRSGVLQTKTYILPSTIGPMSVYLGGGSRSNTGVPFSYGINPNQAVYFSNFQMINGTPGVVPEPASLSLLGLGLLGLFGIGRRKK